MVVTSGAIASVVIPAHNEESVIGRCLAALAAQHSAAGPLEVIVVANGCTDRTAEVARDFASRLPGLIVLEQSVPGKIAALNTGDREATAFPRIYLDADIELDSGAVHALVDTLNTDAPRVAAPQVRFDLGSSSFAVRSFYRVFTRLPYVTNGLIGLGIYGFSRSGRARFTSFPDLIADDLFAERLFSPAERLRSKGSFTVRTPRTLAALLAVRTRVARGNAEFARVGGTESASPASPSPASVDSDASTGSTVRALATLLVTRPTALLDVFVYVAVTIAARHRAVGSSGEWLRDESSREELTPSAAGLRVAYLTSLYPAPSHIFVEREIAGLRARGVQVFTFSVRSLADDQVLSRAMAEEAMRTPVLQSRKVVLVGQLIKLGVLHPLAALTVLRIAAGNGEPIARARLWQGFYYAEAVRLFEEMRTAGLTHLHVHFSNNAADIARLVVALGRAVDGRHAGWRWTMTVHGPTEFEAVAKFDLAKKVRDADAVACISDFTRSQLMRLTPPENWSKLSVVRMSVDTRQYAPGIPPRTGDSTLNILSVGRLVPEKGAPILVESLHRLRRQGVAAQLKLVGAGPLDATLRQQVARLGLGDFVEMTGPVGQDHLPDVYRWADVFVLPSFQEGLPVVLMEAMSTGLPVISTAIAGIPELIENQVSGYVVAPGRPDLVTDALVSLAADPALRQTMGRAGRRRIEGEFALEIVADQQLTFLISAQQGL